MTEPAPVPPSHPETAPKRSPRRIAYQGLVVVAALAAILFILRFAHRSRSSTKSSASSANPEQSIGALRLTGKTEAVESRSILAPLLAGQQVGTLTITWLVPSGTRVKRGDLLVEFDRSAQVRDYMDKQAQSSDETDKVLEAQAKEIADRAKDETDIVQAEDNLRKAQLEMRKVSILSRIDAEKTREDLDEAQATLAQLKETFNLKRKAAAASIRILEIQRDRTRQTMLHAQANAALMEIHSPIDGIVVFNSIWKQGNMGEVQDGDQVRSGVPFMQVVNPSAMNVQVKVNQEDLLALQGGQPARVFLDAYPDLVFPARLESVDPVGQPGDFSPRLRTFAATFSIQGSNARLMPDLSAAVEIHPPGAAPAQDGGQ
ncbi:MAG: HlyD family efflux transporter periplasmic adaptor subunit [Acidobacteriaceae bacterium]